MKVPARRLVLFVALAGVLYLTLSADPPRGAAGDVVEAIDAPGRASDGSSMQNAEITILALRPRGAASEAQTLFASTSWTPPPRPVVVAPAPPPAAPPLPFSYIGKRFDDGVWQVFVTRGDQTLVMREQQTIDGAYRVESIKPPQMSLIYLPLEERQSMNIGAGE